MRVGGRGAPASPASRGALRATSPRAMASAGATAAEARSRASPSWRARAGRREERAAGRPRRSSRRRRRGCPPARRPTALRGRRGPFPRGRPRTRARSTQVTRSRRSGHERSGDVHRRGVLDEDRVGRGRTLGRDDEADDHDRVARRPEPGPRLAQWREGGTRPGRATARETIVGQDRQREEAPPARDGERWTVDALDAEPPVLQRTAAARTSATPTAREPRRSVAIARAAYHRSVASRRGAGRYSATLAWPQPSQQPGVTIIGAPARDAARRRTTCSCGCPGRWRSAPSWPSTSASTRSSRSRTWRSAAWRTRARGRSGTRSASACRRWGPSATARCTRRASRRTSS